MLDKAKAQQIQIGTSKAKGEKMKRYNFGDQGQGHADEVGH